MGFYFRRRKQLSENTHLNVSKSGLSVSYRVGPFTFNSRGRVNVRLGRGFGWRAGS